MQLLEDNKLCLGQLRLLKQVIPSETKVLFMCRWSLLCCMFFKNCKMFLLMFRSNVLGVIAVLCIFFIFYVQSTPKLLKHTFGAFYLLKRSNFKTNPTWKKLLWKPETRFQWVCFMQITSKIFATKHYSLLNHFNLF